MPIKTVLVEEREVKFTPKLPAEKNGVATWRVLVEEVPVRQDDRNLDKLALSAFNVDGRNREEKSVKVIHDMKPKNPAVVRLLRPTQDGTTQRREFPVEFQVESESDLSAVEVYRGDEVLYRSNRKAPKKVNPRVELREQVTLLLKPGPNPLRVEAVNAGGRSRSATIVISYTEPAVYVSIDEIEGIPPNFLPGDEISFAVLPQAVVRLKGRVTWTTTAAKQLDTANLQVTAYVNGSRQLPVAMRPRGSDGIPDNVRRFEVPVLLTRSDNKIRIELIDPNQREDVAQLTRSRREFSVRCGNPFEKQRLHLLIVGVDVLDGGTLRNRVLDTLGATERPRDMQGPFKTRAFDQCILYHVLTGYVERGMVEAQLLKINEEIRKLHQLPNGKMNDVILIFFQGEEVAHDENGRRWLFMSKNLAMRNAKLQYQKQWAIPCDALPRLPGVELLLLNVAGKFDEPLAKGQTGTDPNVSVYRLAWINPRELKKGDPLFLKALDQALAANGKIGEAFKAAGKTLEEETKKEAIAQDAILPEVKELLLRGARQ